MKPKFEALIFTTANDFLRMGNNYRKLVEWMPAEKLIFVGNSEVEAALDRSGLREKTGFLHEESILPFQKIKDIIADILQLGNVPRGIVGWYYQQFLKMQYSFFCKDEYYLVWDGDTVPCRGFFMFDEKSGCPYLDMKREYHADYFVTLERLLPDMRKCVEESFISEHMLINGKIMQNLIRDIEMNKTIEGREFYEKVLRSIDREKLTSNSFSEFETYGTYVCMRYPDVYRMRRWNSFRYGASFFDPDQITDEDYTWLGKDFDAISFEKNQSVREDHKNLFNNKEYQEKLSARQMLEIAQETFTEGYIEEWEN